MNIFTSSVNVWLLVECLILFLFVAGVVYLSVRYVINSLMRQSSILTEDLDEHLDLDLEESCLQDPGHGHHR
jgi:Flp pilus assembly protein TadB